MLKKSLLAMVGLILMSGYASAQDETITYTYSGIPLFIAADGADVITVAPIAIPQALRVTKVTARVRIEYTNVGDLDVFLFSAAGTRTKLLEGNCGSLRNVDTTFDDAAPSRYRDFCPTEAGRGPFMGNEPLSNSNGQSSLGVWRLAVENNESDSRTGWITAFSITITGTRIVTPVISSTTILNAASLRYAGGVAPGELVSIFGAALGPAGGASAPSSTWPTTVGGTSVMANGVAIPVAYASPYRVDVQMPFTLGSDVSLQVSAGGQTSPAVTVPVHGARPGLYTAEYGGLGAVKAINQNGTLNSKAAPAEKGSIITIYASGLGTVQPPLTAGQPPGSTLSRVTLPLSAWIGGVPCPVTYAGSAPGMTAVYQVNIQVDSAVPSGTREISISSGGFPSQTDVTVEIR